MHDRDVFLDHADNNDNQLYKMTGRIDRQAEAFAEAMKICRGKGLDWKESITPVVEEGEITGYRISGDGRTIEVFI